MWMLFCSATTIRDLEMRTRWTGVRNSSVMAACCLLSSHMITCGLVSPQIHDYISPDSVQHTDLVLWVSWLSPSAYQGNVVGSFEHFCCPYAGIEVTRDSELTWFRVEDAEACIEGDGEAASILVE